MNIKKLLITLILIAMAPLAWSQGNFRYGSGERAESWDFSLGLIYLGSESLSGPDDLSVAIKDDYGIGFNFGYNFTNNWALSFEMSYLSPRYTLTGTPEGGGDIVTLSHKMDMFNGLVKGTYNFIDGPVTPFVDLSLGFSYLDSNIKDGPTTCYPDWYWGWVCYSNTASDTRLNYGGGLGIRWDINSDMFLRASYSLMRIDVSNSSDPTFDMGRLEIGWRY